MTTDTQESPDHEIVIVGGGFSGIGAAIMLARAGFDDYLLVEDGDGLGGAWYWNTYPGVGVDIPSFSYQFSFEQMSSWSRVYAPGDELKAYADHCVSKYAIMKHARLGTRIVAAAFDDDHQWWSLTTAVGETITARYVVGATGVLTKPKRPDIDGLDTFEGTVMHTARWDDTVDLKGKKIAVIGTGASAVQAIPAIAPTVGHLTVFQRTPIWCLPKPDAVLPRPARAALSKVPGLKRVVRTVSQIFVELNFPAPAHFDGLVPLTALGERIARRHLRQSVADAVVREQLTPKYALGCKRPSFSNSYLAAFDRANVTLETTAIDTVGPTGIRTADGTEHDVDVIVLATGFKVFEHDNMPPFPVDGSAGRNLATWWDENRFQAFHGVSVPGFPNFFTILGPYGYNGSSYFNLIETQTNHIIRILTEARRRSAKSIEVTEAANAEYFESMLARRKNQVFFQGGCSNANSYYFDSHGDVPFRASPTLETIWTSRRFDLDSYTYS